MAAALEGLASRLIEQLAGRFSQHRRVLRLSTPAGKDALLAERLRGDEGVRAGISLFTYGKAGSSAGKPAQETGIRLHAASGKVSSQSQSGATRIIADKLVTVASVAKSVSVAAREHVLLTAQGAYLKLEGGNIEVHGPGKIEFKASMKELAGPVNSSFDAPILPTAKALYDEQFVLVDKHTGEPMGFVPYRIEGPDGFIVRGVTDENGHTQRVHTGVKRQLLKLFIDG
jgi:type VI secretion system secreted protein VgrG